jgi:lysophospholipase L1-like esterase
MKSASLCAAAVAFCALGSFVVACGDTASPDVGGAGSPSSLGGGGSGSGGGASGGQAPAAGGSSSGGASGGSAPGGGAGGVISNAGASLGGASGAAGNANGGGGSGGGAAGSAGATNNGSCLVPPANAATVYMIGDSTMSVYAANLYPRMGWGQPLGESFAAVCGAVVDKALSGRSSKSFFDEGAWTPVKAALKPGDYVLIQFAHNDEKSDDATRYTEPQTTFKQYLTTYINDTREKQATPILLTPINRNNWSGATVQDSHKAYPPAMRELATSLQVPLIDLTALTKTYFERIGQVETTKLFLVLTAGQSPNYPDGVTDSTHLQEAGARKIGQLALSDAYTQKLKFTELLKQVPVPP